MSKRQALTLNDVFLALIGSSPLARDVPVSGVVIDSRQATEGSIFIALPGEHTDGHLYIDDAFARGAIAAIVQRAVGAPVIDLGRPVEKVALPGGVPGLCLLVGSSQAALQKLGAWWRAQFDVRVIGITGSVGKTTTKEFVAAVLAQRYCVLKSEGSYNNELGLPLTLLELNDTHERVVLEMGTYGPGEITQLADLARPHVGVVTNVGPVHVERMGTIERIAEAKSELLQALPASGVAILNGDDERVRAMAGKTLARPFFYGLTPNCDLWADQVESHGLEGLSFCFHAGSETIPAQAPLVGQHSIYTALRAAAVGLVEGLAWDEILRGLYAGEQVRLKATPGIHGAMLIDDTYNSSPDTAIAALNLLDELDGRKIAVLGDMLELGDYTAEGHCRVGRRAAGVVSILVTVGELGRLIGQEALACGMPAGQVISLPDNVAAIDYLRNLIGAGDIVLIKGSRGMAMEKIVAVLRLPREQ